jgi:2-polyprenyl-3-methyl-5-hydroxy-6-metoxy-1,4-benzoquinol methylase
MLTGRVIDFGNFCLVPNNQIVRITHMGELWNHFAGTLVRSKTPLASLGTVRGKRYAGQSTMNFVSLVVHGLSAISVFSDLMFVRLLVASVAVGIVPVLISVVALALRFTTDLAIPGWNERRGLRNSIGSADFDATDDQCLRVTRRPIKFPVRARYSRSELYKGNDLSAQHDDEANRYVYKGTELDVFALATNWKAYWASRIETHIGSRVLEVGAGLGATARILCGNQKKWIALEPDPALARRMRNDVHAGDLPSICDVRTGTLQDLDASERFDTVLYIDVLEHIKNDRDELERAMSRLDVDGRIIVLAPAHQFLYTAFDKSIGHFRRYDRGMISALNPSGLTLFRFEYLDSFGFLVMSPPRPIS